MERVQKFIAESGFSSRRKAEEFISKGLVTVNGKVVSLGDKCFESDEIRVGGRRILQKRVLDRYFVLNKPIGYVCSHSGSEGPSVFDLLPKDDGRITFAGRLDKDSSGLLILSSDGGFIQKVIHPSSKIEKEYIVSLDKNLKEDDRKKLESGVFLDSVKLKSLRIERRGRDYSVVLFEGRKRQIRRMFDSLGYLVLRLERVRIAGFKISGIKPGKYREFKKEELLRLLGLH